jgi:hypothetical protein
MIQADVKENVGLITFEYRLRYLAKVDSAILQYLQWMERNTQGYRFFNRFKHMFHGRSGITRAEKLRADIGSGEIDFYDIVNAVGLTIAESGYTEHSLRRFIFENMTEKQVIACPVIMSEKHFEIAAFNYIHAEYEKIISPPVSEEQATTPHGTYVLLEPAYSLDTPAEAFSYWGLTEMVQRIKTIYYSPEEDIEDTKFATTVAGLVLEILEPPHYNHRDHDIHGHHVHRLG